VVHRHLQADAVAILAFADALIHHALPAVLHVTHVTHVQNPP
jgi:hypothetical protein